MYASSYRVLFGRKSRNLISYHLLYFAEFWHFNVICWLVCAWDKWCRCRGISRQIQHRITQKKSQSFFPILNWIFADSRKESFLKPLHDTLNCTAVVVTVKILHTRSIQEWRHAWVWSLFWLKYPRPVSSVPAVTAWHQLNSWNVQLLVTREWTELSGVSECHFIRSAAGNVADFPLFYSIIWTVAKLYCRVQNSLHMAAAPRLLYARGSGQTAQRGQCGCTECTLHQDTQIPSPEMPTLMRCSVFSGKIILIHDSGRGVICHLKAYNLSLWKSALKQCLHTSL